MMVFARVAMLGGRLCAVVDASRRRMRRFTEFNGGFTTGCPTFI